MTWVVEWSVAGHEPKIGSLADLSIKQDYWIAGQMGWLKYKRNSHTIKQNKWGWVTFEVKTFIYQIVDFLSIFVQESIISS